jgi:hypothetical protein
MGSAASNLENIQVVSATDADTKAIIKAFWIDFRNGQSKIYLLGNGKPPAPGFPGYTFRKLDANRISLLAWRSRDEAEKWIITQGFTEDASDAVSEMDYPMLKGLIGNRQSNVVVELF